LKAVVALALLSALMAAAQNHPDQHAADSATLLFEGSDSAAALRQAAIELRRRPHDLTALFVQMEAARLQLNSRLELSSALAILETGSKDPRATVAAERVRQLAGNTSLFRTALPRLGRILSAHPASARVLSEALLTAASDGVQVPSSTMFAHRIQRWQIAGPFGKYSNVDFDRPWPPQRDHLRSSQYGQRFRETIYSHDGLLQLPDYLSRQGVYYAASNFSVARRGMYQFAIESDGTYDFQVDGRRLVHHDARFHEVGPLTFITVPLLRGKHRVALKLHPAAMPLRVWIEAASSPATRIAGPAGEKEYMTAAVSFLQGDPRAALDFDLEKTNIAVFRVLAAEVLIQEDQQLAREALEAALVADPHAVLAEFQLAALDFDSDRFEEEAAHLSQVLKTAPQYWPAQELKYRLAAHFGWKREQHDALMQRLHLHPDCSALVDATTFYSDEGDFEKALGYEKKLSSCSNRPLDDWQHLSQSGRHSEALARIRGFLRYHPADRRALERAVHEAVLAGNERAALEYARRLRSVAPNSAWAATLGNRPGAILDSRSAAGNPGDFYRPYVRDSRISMETSSASNSDAELLMNDEVIKIDRENAWVYRHLVTQVFDKRGIEQAGEIDVPPGSEILVLRTLKQNGTAVEPEVSENKSSISMAGLEIDDAVEVAYLRHFSREVLEESPGILDFAFSSAIGPTISARLTVIREAGTDPLLWHSPAVRKINTVGAEGSANKSWSVDAWEASNLSTPPAEPDSPRYNHGPVMRWLSLDKKSVSDFASHLRDQLIEATKITQRIEKIARQVRSDACPPTQHASSLPGKRGCAARDLVEAASERAAKISDEPQSWLSGTVTSADQSFQQSSGNRAAALISLLSAMGFTADLELAAELGSRDPLQTTTEPANYKHALVRVTVPGSSAALLLDPELEGVAAGALSPHVEGEPAIVIGRVHPVDRIDQVPRATDQRSIANAELQMDSSGGLHGSIRIRFGSLRGAQMRDALRQLADKDRQNYFEQIAARILPGAGDVAASIQHEDHDAEALELKLEITAPGRTNSNDSQLEMGQLIPELGLSRLYASLPSRQEDLLIDTPLVEHSEFTLHLPPGTQVSHLPAPVELANQFGNYRAGFSVTNNTLSIVRDFSVPVQIIPSSDYPSFQSFAFAVDNFERQSITLRRGSMAKSAPKQTQSQLH
jgi:tetratricopeptide (TPR) repeat protein